MSVRTLRRHFAQYVGLSPKQMARVIRFQRLLASIVRPSPINFATMAQRAGYSDQAHMTRDFAELVGAFELAFLHIASKPFWIPTDHPR